MPWSTEGAPRKVINMQEWEAKMEQAKISKDDMNRLIMNFFVTEGYVDAAKAFHEESGTKPGVDLGTITDRMEIRQAVQSGKVYEAIEKVNDLDPEILDQETALYFHLQQQRLIELIRIGNVDDALRFAQEYLAPPGEENPKYLEELERTLALLAFEDVSKSPLSELMEVSQRQKTASELNSAILQRQCQEKQARLPGILKIMLWAQKRLDQRASYPRIQDLTTARLVPPSTSTLSSHPTS